MWDERYSDEEYAYGTQPNTFLADAAKLIGCDKTPGHKRVLSLAEGEGRNAVFLAEQGCQVTAVDASAVGLAKAEKLARERGVTITTQHLNLADLEIQPDSWDVIISIFCHVPLSIRKQLHRKVVAGLRPGGILLLEAYTPDQLALKTGGPQDVDMTMTLQQLEAELDGLNFDHTAELHRDVVEGKYHTGRGAVVQIIAHKP